MEIILVWMNLLCYLPTAKVGKKGCVCVWMDDKKNVSYVFTGTSPDGTVYVDIVVSLGIFISWTVQMSLHCNLSILCSFWKTSKKSSPVILAERKNTSFWSLFLCMLLYTTDYCTQRIIFHFRVLKMYDNFEQCLIHCVVLHNLLDVSAFGKAMVKESCWTFF